jgi:hypothetical protein
LQFPTKEEKGEKWRGRRRRKGCIGGKFESNDEQILGNGETQCQRERE